MKKKILIATLGAAAALACAIGLAACGENNKPKDITGVTFEDKTVYYDGNEHSVTVTGTLPENVSVSYTNNTGTNVGVYNATAILSGTGYNTLTLNAKLTIENDPSLLTITGVTFADKTVTYNGSEHEITVTGTLPEGVSVSYTNNTGTNAGTYNATAVLSGEGYNPLTLTATLKIEKAEITGVTFSNNTVTYDGNEHEITVSGTLPTGVSVSYTNNKGTNANTYNAAATLSGDNYVTKTLNATLTIDKAEITGVSFENQTITHDGEEHTLTVTGTIPAGVTVSYTNNTGKGVRIYNATATLSGANYITKTLNAKLFIKPDFSKIWESVSERPTPWSFIPEGLRPENIAYTTAPASDFTSFVSVSTIGKKPIGRQFNVLYEGLTDTEKMLGYFDSVYAVGATVANLYQDQINNDPESYAEFEFDPGEDGGFHGKITLNNNLYQLLIGNTAVSLELSYNTDTGLRTGRIQASDGMAIKYESTENSLTLAIKTTISGAGNLKKIHFLCDENGNMNGYYYEYTGTTGEDGKGLKTSAALFSNATKLVVVSDKKELQDLKTNACEEVYNAVTGEYIGSEVEETVSKINYDTLWFMLPNVNGLTSIKVDPTANKENPDTIYINGNATAIKTKTVGSGLKMLSRRFDIEMRDVWYVVKVQDGEKVKYETQKVSIPMLFVQKEQTGTFTADFNEKNNVSLTLKSNDITNITNDYTTTRALYLQFKEQSSAEEVEAYIGNKNSYFGD